MSKLLRKWETFLFIKWIIKQVFNAVFPSRIPKYYLLMICKVCVLSFAPSVACWELRFEFAKPACSPPDKDQIYSEMEFAGIFMMCKWELHFYH